VTGLIKMGIFNVRKKGLSISALLILVLIGIPMGFALNRPGNEMKQDFSIMTCNIGDIVGGNPLESDQVVTFIRDCGVPDVLLLQEVRGEKEAKYLSRQLNRPWFVFLPDYHSAQMGIAILSRWPVLNHDTLYFKDSRRGAGAVAVELDIHGTRLWAVNVHQDRNRFSVCDGRSWAEACQSDPEKPGGSFSGPGKYSDPRAGIKMGFY
jgi:endonuclease/exonuclease/phosphatase (EEP) superfamily protein YafD